MRGPLRGRALMIELLSLSDWRSCSFRGDLSDREGRWVAAIPRRPRGLTATTDFSSIVVRVN